MERILTQIVLGAPASPLSLSNGLAQPHLSLGFLQQDFCLQSWALPASLFHYAARGGFSKTIVPTFPSAHWSLPAPIHLLVASPGISHPPSPTCLPLWTCSHPPYVLDPSIFFGGQDSKGQGEGGDAGERDNGRQKETQRVMRGEEVGDRAWY